MIKSARERSVRPLGQQLASYPSTRRPKMSFLAWGAVTGAMAAGLVGPWSESFGWPGILIRVGVACLAVGIVVGIRRFRPGPSVDLHQHGIGLVRGRKRHHIYWNQIEEIYQVPQWHNGPDHQLSWVLRIVRRDGRSFQLSQFESLHGLGMRIQHQIARRQLPAAIDAYRAGYSVRFGQRLIVSGAGIQCGSELIGWPEISEISIDETREIQVLRHGERRPAMRVPIAQVPNLSVLDGILRATQEQESDETSATDSSVVDDLSQGEADFTDLLSAGFDWNDLQELQSGNVSVDDLLQRGPCHRPRQPR